MLKVPFNNIIFIVFKKLFKYYYTIFRMRNLIKKAYIPSSFILYYSYQTTSNILDYNWLYYNKL